MGKTKSIQIKNVPFELWKALKLMSFEEDMTLGDTCVAVMSQALEVEVEETEEAEEPETEEETEEEETEEEEESAPRRKTTRKTARKKAPPKRRRSRKAAE